MSKETNNRVQLGKLPQPIRRAIVHAHSAMKSRQNAIFECLQQTHGMMATSLQIHQATEAAMIVLHANDLTDVTESDLRAYYNKLSHARSIVEDARRALRAIAVCEINDVSVLS